MFCFPLSARLEQARFGSTVQPPKQGHQWGKAMCLHNSVLYYSGRDSISLASFELREMTTYRGVHILRKEVHKFSIAVTKRIVHNRAVSILWRKEFYRLGILGTKSNAHNGEVSPF